MTKDNDTKTFSVRLDKGRANTVEKVTQRIDCSFSDLMKNALDFYLMNHKVDEVSIVIKKQQLVRLSA